MRTADQVDGVRFQRFQEAARAASDADRPEEEAHYLRSALSLIAGGLPANEDTPFEALTLALCQSSRTLREHILDVSLELAGALMKFDMTAAALWIEFVAAGLGTEQPGETPFVRRIRINLIGAQGALQVLAADPARDRAAGLAHETSPPVRGQGTVQRLAMAMNHVRKLASQGRRQEALAVLGQARVLLDLTAHLAEELAELADWLSREIAAESPLERRIAILAQARIMAPRAANEGLVMLLRADARAAEAGRNDLRSADLAEALALADAPQAAPMRGQVLGRLAEVEIAEGRTASAILFGKLAVNELAAVARALAAREVDRPRMSVPASAALEDLVEALISVGRLEEAEEAAAVLRDDLAFVDPLSLSDRELGALEQVRVATDLPRVLRTLSPRASQAVRVPAPAPEPGVARLTYRTEGEELVCDVETPDGRATALLGVSAEQANEGVFAVRQAILRGCAADAPPLRAAFDALLREPLRLAGSARRLEISGRGALRAMPWAALYDGDAPVVARAAILRRLETGEASQAPRGPARIAAFAATRATAGLGALGEDAADEARAVASAARQGLVRLDAHFTEAAVAAALQQASIAHFATHLVPHAARFTQARLCLGDGETLTIAGLARLITPSVDLVVLSACASAASGPGELEGEAIDGMLLAAGAGAVLGTLWPVPNRAMRHLVPAVLAGFAAGLDKPEALARAQQAALRAGGDFARPLTFAALTVAGNPHGWPPGAFDT